MKTAAHFLSDLDGQIARTAGAIARIREAGRGRDLGERESGIWEGQIRALLETLHELRTMRAAWAAGEPAFYATEKLLGEGDR